MHEMSGPTDAFRGMTSAGRNEGLLLKLWSIDLLMVDLTSPILLGLYVQELNPAPAKNRSSSEIQISILEVLAGEMKNP